MPVEAVEPQHVSSRMELGLTGRSESLRPRRSPPPDLPLREECSLLAPAGMEDTHRRSMGAALRPAAGVHAASRIAREPQ
eukprot:12398412-Heterocapsa_arctica.AAC.1